MKTRGRCLHRRSHVLSNMLPLLAMIFYLPSIHPSLPSKLCFFIIPNELGYHTEIIITLIHFYYDSSATNQQPSIRKCEVNNGLSWTQVLDNG